MERVRGIGYALGQRVQLGLVAGYVVVSNVQQSLELPGLQRYCAAIGPCRGYVAGAIGAGDHLTCGHIRDQIRPADLDRDRPVLLGHDRGRKDRAQLSQKLGTLIQQIVGVVARDGDALYLAVEAGDLSGDVVDRRDLLTHLAVDPRGDHAELSGVAVDLHREARGLFRKGRPSGHRGWVGSHVLPRAEVLAYGVAEARTGRLREYRLDLGELLVARTPLTLQRGLSLDLTIEEGVPHAGDGGDRDAGADLAGQTAAVERRDRVRRRLD